MECSIHARLDCIRFVVVVCHCRVQKYFQSGTLGSSELEVEWTNQHGCGGNEDSDPHKLNCNMVLQYMCQVGGH